MMAGSNTENALWQTLMMAGSNAEPALREDAIIKFRKIKRQIGEKFSHQIREAGTPELNSSVGF